MTQKSKELSQNNELSKFEEFSALRLKKIKTEEKLQKNQKEFEEFSSKTAEKYADKKAGSPPAKPSGIYIDIASLLLFLLMTVLSLLMIAFIIGCIVGIILCFASKDNVALQIVGGVGLCIIGIPLSIYLALVPLKATLREILPHWKYFSSSMQYTLSLPAQKKAYPAQLAYWEKQIEFFKKEYSKTKTKLSEKVKNTKQELLDINKELQSYTTYLEVFDATVEDDKIENSTSLVNVKRKVLSYWDMEYFYRHIQDDKFINHYKNLFEKWHKEKISHKKQDLWCDDAVEELIIAYLKSSNTFTFSSTIEKIVSVLLFTIEKEEERLEGERKANEKEAKEWKLCWDCQSYKDGGGRCPMAPKKECSAFRMAKEENVFDYSLCYKCINYGDNRGYCPMAPKSECAAFRLKQARS